MMKMGAALRFVRHFFGIESSVESEGGVPIKRASSDSAKVVVRGGRRSFKQRPHFSSVN
jgi:hypothetical protein